MKKEILLVWFVFQSVQMYAQNTIGLPDILSFSHEITKGGSQTWQITQDRFGTMYFANNSGLLTYNNKEWKLYPLPNKTIVRSLFIDEDDKIYVGGQGIIGYFLPDRNGFLQFHNLNYKIQAQHKSFDDVWYIVSYKNDIFFQSSKKIFKLNKAAKRIDVYSGSAELGWSFLGVVKNRLVAQNNAEHFVNYQNHQWQSVPAPQLQYSLITSILDFGKDTVIVSTLKEGLFLITHTGILKINVSPEITKSQIFRLCRVNDDVFAIGTVSNGIFLISKKAEVLMHFSIDNGMQNNNVLSLFVDNRSNLWAGLDEGIDLINYSSPIHIISPIAKTFAPAYTANIFNNNLYIGTSNGLYSTPLTASASQNISLSQGKFRRIENSDRQVWSFFNDRTRLLMGHHDGIFQISGQKLIFLDNKNGGCWLFRKVPGSKNLITGNYLGLQLLEDKMGKLLPTQKLASDLKEPLRFIETDSANHLVWASHPYRGIYRMQLSRNFDRIQEIKLLTKKDGLPEDLNNFVFKVNNKVVFATVNGVYEYNYEKGNFQVSARFLPIFGSTSIKYMISDHEGKIWFATETGMGVLEGSRLKYLPELDGMLIAGFENINPYNDKNIFIGSNKGIVHLNYEAYKKKNAKISAIINRVVAIGKKDSVLFNGYFVSNDKLRDSQDATMINELSPAFNSFHFEFSSDQYGSPDKTMFSYILEGFDKEWASWSTKNEKDYTNLPHGSYTFLVKAKDNQGTQSKPIRYSFIIKPKWYQTKLAYIIYVILMAVFFFTAHKIHGIRLQRQRQNFEKEQDHLKYVHELELERNEKEIIQLKNERLETEVMYKNKELASTTMHLYKRGRLIGKIKEDLTEGLDKLKIKDDKAAFKKLIKLLADEEKQDLDWEQFSIHFDQVHNNFLHNIKKSYPDLTPGDLKICAYLKMNLSSKEIAQLLNISLKGVEIARYRLRRKFGLHQNVNLTNFINWFYS